MCQDCPHSKNCPILHDFFEDIKAAAPLLYSLGDNYLRKRDPNDTGLLQYKEYLRLMDKALLRVAHLTGTDE